MSLDDRIELVRGNHADLVVTVVDAASANVNLSASTTVITASAVMNVRGTVLFSKSSSTASQIEKSSTTTNVCIIHLLDTDTYTAEPGIYNYDVVVKKDGKVRTVITNNIILRAWPSI